jgi:hypothetical protein
MSVFEKQRRNRSYVYFQSYSDGKRSTIYLGPRDEMATWEKAERLFLEYLDHRLQEFYSRIPAEFKAKVQPREGPRRLLEAGIPQAEPEKRVIEVPQLRSPVSPENVHKILRKTKRRRRKASDGR